ncbi:MAG TPA: hypothetical protein VE136_10095 [Anaerolineales bacterium]|jgi:hypothetical protein|nr:hypothetical protein [Anaerolineales bacterium]
MKNAWPLRTIVILSLVVVFLLSAAAPASVQARSELVRLTVINRSAGTVYLSLNGPALYYLSVKADESEVFTVQRGTYTSSITACGITSKDSLDITSHKKLIMPVCGGRAHGAHGAATKVDLSEQIKIVPFTIINDSDTQLLAVLTGAGTYAFLLDKDEERDYTIAKGDYDVKIYACRAVTTIEFSSYKDSKLDLRCPQHYTD